MKTFNFKKLDAFATNGSSGNPAGAIYLNSTNDITASEMQQIARELKGFVSEVGYLSKLDDNLFNLKYYSSEREVDFCGHATIAIMYDLIKNDNNLLYKDRIQIRTNKGKLAVINRIKQDDAVFISAPKPGFSEPKMSIKEIAKALRIKEEYIDTNSPLSINNAGLETLIVPISNLESILAVTPDLEELKQFCISQHIDIITVFTSQTADKNNAFRTRVFAPTFGYLEDPATGSGNSAFGYYLLKNKKWNENSLSIEQNSYFDNPNIIKLEFAKDEVNESRVLFGGGAAVRISGKYFLG